MPRKETKPEAPDIESNVEHVNVEVTPKDESTKLEVKYTDTNGQPSSIIAIKWRSLGTKQRGSTY